MPRAAGYMAMRCKEVEVVLEQQGFVPVPEAARAHLAGCSSCQGLIADLTAIVATAHLLPAEVEPPLRVWTSLRAQLEDEGIIKGAGARTTWWHPFSELFRARALATAGVGVLVVAAIVLQVRPPATHPTEARSTYENYDDTSMTLSNTLSNDEAHLPSMRLAGSSKVDVALRQNLDIVDKFIVDCEQRVKEQPGDELARDYLTGAYQQKAELLSVMMERGGVY
jgi:hypothetical protein